MKQKEIETSLFYPKAVKILLEIYPKKDKGHASILPSACTRGKMHADPSLFAPISHQILHLEKKFPKVYLIRTPSISLPTAANPALKFSKWPASRQCTNRATLYERSNHCGTNQEFSIYSTNPIFLLLNKCFSGFLGLIT